MPISFSMGVTETGGVCEATWAVIARLYLKRKMVYVNVCMFVYIIYTHTSSYAHIYVYTHIIYTVLAKILN